MEAFFVIIKVANTALNNYDSGYKTTCRSSNLEPFSTATCNM